MPDPVDDAIPFAHLHTHTEYSLLDGAARIDQLVNVAKQMGQESVAITDHGVLYGAVEFYMAAKAAEINPVVGCEMYMAPRSRHDKEGRADRDPNHLILLAKDETGYRNLIKLVSRSHLEGYYYKPRIDKQLLAELSEGLICLSGCIGGELPQAILSGNMDAAERVARQYLEIFGRDNYFLELQDHGIPEEDAIRAGLLEISRRLDLPLVATNDSHYIEKTDAEAHDILLCIQTGSRQEEEKRFRFFGPQFYVASGAEMQRKFAAYTEAVANSVAIARRCHLDLQLGQSLLPKYSPIPQGHTAESYLRELCEAGLRERYGTSPGAEARARLEMELDVISGTGFAPYFLIVWDLIRAARHEGVSVGPGRGSAAGSIVSYVLHITNICPLKYDLIFERFLNRERVEMPDIDIDFDDRNRDKVIAYAAEKYGHDRVAQIVTFGTMAARAAIRDVGRALNIPLPDVDRLAKSVPQAVGMTLERALQESRDLRDLYESEPWVQRVIENARKLEGICRNASTHAAAVVIGPEPLENLVPLQRSTIEHREAAVTQFDMKGVSKVGLLKIDFLGLSNLTVIAEAIQIIKAVRGIELDTETLPIDDAATFDLLCRADTHGVFQLEATFARRILLDMQPRTVEDVAVASALNRPGPIEGGVVDTYMRRKRGEEMVDYPLPLLEPILKATYGTIVYQDQVMKIAQAVAGFSLGEADILRGAMGKKDKVRMAKQREKFISGALANGIDEAKAIELFDLMAFFAGYGFNLAHAMAYAFISYQTAYLKANYPLEYACALLNSRAGDLDKVKATIVDAHAHGLVVRAPSINRSHAGFAVGDAEAGEILFGLQHIKNVGEKVIEEVMAERQRNGEFASVYDLCVRVGSRDLNRRVLEALIKSGACDEFGDRAALLQSLDRIMDRAATVRRERDSGQTALFAEDEIEVTFASAEEAPADDELDAASAVVEPEEKLRWERELLGMYLSDHPLRRIADRLPEKMDTAIGELGGHLEGLYVQIAGVVRNIRAFVPKRSSTGQRMAFLELEDLTGACEIVVFPKTFDECAALLREDAILVVRGRVEADTRSNHPPGHDEDEGGEEPPKIIAEAVYGFDDPRLLGWRRNLSVHINISEQQQGKLASLYQTIADHPGDAAVSLHVETASSYDVITLADEFAVDASAAFERAVEALLGDGAYRVEVKRNRAVSERNNGQRFRSGNGQVSRTAAHQAKVGAR